MRIAAWSLLVSGFGLTSVLAAPPVSFSRALHLLPQVSASLDPRSLPCPPSAPEPFVCPGDPRARNAADCEESFCRLPQNIPEGYAGTPREVQRDGTSRVFEIHLRTQLTSHGQPLGEEEGRATMRRIQTCYDEASPFLSGTLPDGTRGRIQFKMEPGGIEIYEDDGTRHAPLFVAPFEAGMRCETLLQETLIDIGSLDNGSGLGDEYPITERYDPHEGERSGGPLQDSDSCRVIGPDDSLMRRLPAAGPDRKTGFTRFARASIESGGYTLNGCNCPSYSMYGAAFKACRAELARLAQQAKSGSLTTGCPAATHRVDEQRFTRLEMSGNPEPEKTLRSALADGLERGKLDEEGVSFTWLAPIPSVAPPERSSILYPAQFRKLLFPGCKRLNSVYDACIAGADLLNRKQACPPRPPICRDRSDAWLQ